MNVYTLISSGPGSSSELRGNHGFHNVRFKQRKLERFDLDMHRMRSRGNESSESIGAADPDAFRTSELRSRREWFRSLRLLGHNLCFARLLELVRGLRSNESILRAQYERIDRGGFSGFGNDGGEFGSEFLRRSESERNSDMDLFCGYRGIGNWAFGGG